VLPVPRGDWESNTLLNPRQSRQHTLAAEPLRSVFEQFGQGVQNARRVRLRKACNLNDFCFRNGSFCSVKQ